MYDFDTHSLAQISNGLAQNSNERVPMIGTGCHPAGIRSSLDRAKAAGAPLSIDFVCENLAVGGRWRA